MLEANLWPVLRKQKKIKFKLPVPIDIPMQNHHLKPNQTLFHQSRLSIHTIMPQNLQFKSNKLVFEENEAEKM